MTRPKDSSPRRLPQEVELQARREELFKQIHGLGENNPQGMHVYFLVGDEMFGLSLNRDTFMSAIHENMQWTLNVEPYRTVERDIYGTTSMGGQKTTSITHVKRRTFYDRPINFSVAGLGVNGRLYGMDGNEIDSVDKLNVLNEIAEFMNSSDKSNFDSPLSDVSKSNTLKELIEKIRETPRMRFEYSKPEFYKLLRRVESKAAKTDYSKYDPEGDNIAATTGWIKVEKDGQEYELKFDIAGQINNGSYDELDEVSRREAGDNGEGRYLFGETGLWLMGSINNLEKIQECIDMLKLLDEALPNSVSTSS